MSEMLEKILSNENIGKACKRVYANKGAGGVDEVTTKELGTYMKANWKSIKEQIRMRNYKPQPVLRVEIPKPNGGVRKLGIPTVIDRVIEQAILHRIDTHLRTILRVVIWKQWKTAKKREWGLLKLGVEKWLAHKVANWGTHYQFVATKSVVARAISKGKLTKRRLVSLSDYYKR